MESKTSIHSSHSSNEAREHVVGEQDVYNEKRADSSLYANEDVIGTKDQYRIEDSPIEEVRAVVPK